MSNSVLVVEDSHELWVLLERALTPRGYDVRCAASIPDAITALNATCCPCLVLWDPTTLPLSSSIVTLAGRLGVHIATIPVGVSATGQAPDGAPIIAKRLTSLDAVLSVLRQHCPGVEEQALV
jgi:CheY-like chemotaxis protein